MLIAMMPLKKRCRCRDNPINIAEGQRHVARFIALSVELEH